MGGQGQVSWGGKGRCHGVKAVSPVTPLTLCHHGAPCGGLQAGGGEAPEAAEGCPVARPLRLRRLSTGESRAALKI